MNFELILFGLITGFTSGFFGIGGGAILIPMLLIYGFKMKEAVSISIMQMVFSSIYGSIINSKKTKGLFKDGIILGTGATFGGFISGYFLPSIPDIYLQYIFLLSLIYTVYSLIKAPVFQDSTKEEKNILILLFIGLFVGIMAMSIGIGGALLLLPILVRFLKYDLKVATSLSLFFVMFSSISGFISTSIFGKMLYLEGLIVAVGSLIGVYFGIKIKEKTKATSYKKYVIYLNIFVLIITIYETFFNIQG